MILNAISRREKEERISNLDKPRRNEVRNLGVF